MELAKAVGPRKKRRTVPEADNADISTAILHNDKIGELQEQGESTQ